MKRLSFILLVFVFLFACAKRGPEKAITYTPSGGYKTKKILFAVKLLEKPKYVEKVSVIKQNLGFSCVTPDFEFLYENKLKKFFPDFDVALVTPGLETALIELKPKFLSKLQGGLVFGSNYLLSVQLDCSLRINGRVFDCSSLAWKVYGTQDLDRAEGFCPQHPVEYLFVYEVLPVAVEKSLIRIRKSILEAYGFKPDKKLVEACAFIEEEWKRYGR